MRLAGRRYDQGQPVWVEVLDDMIVEMGTWRGAEKATLPWIAPGLVDLQVNGYGGREFTDPGLTVDAVEQISLAMDRDGVTTYLPTVITHGSELLLHAVATIAEAMDTREPVRRRAAGIHLEGPYISAEDGPRGAHPLEHCRPPDWDEFQRLQQAARGYIRIVTLSPEYETSADFIRRAAAAGVTVSIGHTNADTSQIHAAVDAGARMSTHLGNAAHAVIPRHPNYVWDQMAEDRLIASLIADGHHLPPAVVKCMIRCKTPERVVLISDITGIAGTVGSEPGRYENTSLGSVELLDDGRVVIAGQREYLAGATLPLRIGVTNVMQYAHVDLAAAIDMATVQPAALLNLSCGRLAPHAAADLIQFRLPDEGGPIEILATINAGQCVYGVAESWRE